MAERPLKILIVMGGFFPGRKYGGPPVSVDNFCLLMKDEAECYIVTHNHDKNEIAVFPDINEGWNDRGNARVLYLSNEEYGYHTFEKVIKEIKPDYIYLQGLFQQSVYPCLKLAKKFGLSVVLAPRGELCVGAFKKKYKKLLYIWMLRMRGLTKNVKFQSTSDEETEAIHRYLDVPFDRIHLLRNIPSIPHTLPEHRAKVIGEGRFIFISRILWKKNLFTAINYFQNIKGNVTFDIYGPKEDEKYWNECEDAIKQLPANISVNYCGVLCHDEVHNTFCQYDAFLFPTLSENYGHVIAEALVTGCIPIISDQTPWTDMNEAGAGWALSLEDEPAFKRAIQEVVDMDETAIVAKRNAMEKYLQEKLQLEKLKREYLKVFYYIK